MLQRYLKKCSIRSMSSSTNFPTPTVAYNLPKPISPTILNLNKVNFEVNINEFFSDFDGKNKLDLTK